MSKSGVQSNLSRAAARPRSRWPMLRLGAVVRVTILQALRMHFWLMAPLAILILIAVDLSSERFDPVFETIPAAMGTALFTLAVLAVLIGTFLATYAFPAEVESRVAYTVTTKPVGPTELIAGKVLGMALLLAGMLAAVGAGAYAYFHVRAGDVRALAAQRRAEAAPRARHAADLNALDAMARLGPLRTYQYRRADSGPEIRIRHPADAQVEPDTLWILGESGARLRWDLSQTPLRTWVRLYTAVYSAAATTEALQAAMRLGIQAKEAEDEPAAREALAAAAQRITEAAKIWDLAARLWEDWLKFLAAHPPPAPAAAAYRETAQAVIKAADAFAKLAVETPPENAADWESRIPAVPFPTWSCLLLLETDVRPPPEQPDAPTTLVLRIVPLGPGSESAGDKEERGFAIALQQTGPQTYAVPLLPPHAALREGALRLPLNTDVAVDVRARGPGHLVGVRPGALWLVGPGGEMIPAPSVPEVPAEEFRRRLWIYGRTHEPRQTAVFRFRNIPEAILGEEAIPVEIGFTLAAWSATTIETTAEATFINPATGEQRAFRFTPETQRSTLLYLDRAFWHGGDLDVRLECLTDEDSFGLVGESIRLRLDGGPFAWNFAKAVAHVWLFGTALAAVGVFLSVRLSWFVSIFAAITVFIVGMSRPFILRATPIGQAAERLAQRAPDAPFWEWLTSYLVPPIPNLRTLLPPGTVTMGEALPMADLATALAWTAACLLILILLGGYLLRTREVAA